MWDGLGLVALPALLPPPLDPVPEPEQAVPQVKATTRRQQAGKPKAKAKARGSAKRQNNKTKKTQVLRRARATAKATAKKNLKTKATRTRTLPGQKPKRTKPDAAFDTPTSWKEYFHWPTLLLDRIFTHFSDTCPPSNGKLNIRLHTEFSGAGTPEFALKALASASRGKIGVKVLSQSDVDGSCQKVLIANAEPETHVFADIMEVCPPEMTTEIERYVAVKAGAGILY